MAQLFPMTAGEIGGDDDGQPSLAATLVALPDPWTVLRDRPIGDGDGTERVDVVLVHPEIGVALIDEAPRDPTSAVAVLRAYLDDQRFAEFFPGELPLVALSVASDELWEIGDRLAAAFEAAPLLSIADRDWADAVIELLLLPDELGAAAAGPASDASAKESLPNELDAALAEPASDALAEEPPPEPTMTSLVERPLEGGDRILPHLAAPLDLDHASLRVDSPSVGDEEPRRRWRGLTVAAALTVILSAGLGLAAWRLGQEEPNLPPASASVAAPPVIDVPSPQQPLEEKKKTAAPPAIPAPRPATPAPPPVPPARPVVLAAKPLAPLPPAPPVPTPIEPLPQVAATAAPPAPAAQPRASAAGAPSPAQPPDSTASHVSPAPAQPNRRAAAQQRAPAAAPPPPRQEAHVAPSRPRPAERAPGPPIDAADLPPLEPAPPPPIALTATPVPNARECRPYTSDTTLAGRGLPVQGIACRDPDGAWRLMSEVPLR